MKTLVLRLCVFLVIPFSLQAREWHVNPSFSGDGSVGLPFGSIQQGVDAAKPGDVVIIHKGSYDRGLASVISGSATAPITIKAAGPRGSVQINHNGCMVRIAHEYIVVEGLVLDGNYVDDDLVKIDTNANYAVIRNCEIRRTSRDGVDIDTTRGVLIENCLIHHCLNSKDGRTDSHAIVAGAAKDLTIRNTRCHTFSGDAFQTDPSRQAPGWDNVLIEGCAFWLTPMSKPEAGFAAKTVPGENAVDTKVWTECPFRPKLTIRNTVASGYRKGLIDNMAAFNLKENIEAVLDGITVSDSEIAFRIRGPSQEHPGGAKVIIQNAVVYDCDDGARIEDNPPAPIIRNVTFGKGVKKSFNLVSDQVMPIIQNILIMGQELLPVKGSNVQFVEGTVFVKPEAHDYHLLPKTSPINAGMAVSGVDTDRDGIKRPQEGGYDVGAYEWTSRTDIGKVVMKAEDFPSPSELVGESRQGSNGKRSIYLAWKDQSANEQGFEVERSTDGTNWVKVATTEADMVTHGDSGVTSGTRYFYRIRGCNPNGYSAYSDVVEVKTEAAALPPWPPYNLTASTPDGSAELKWEDKSDNEDGFEMERSTDGKTWQSLGTKKANSGRFKDNGGKVAPVCHYRVCSFNSQGKSAWSNTVTVRFESSGGGGDGGGGGGGKKKKK